MSSGEACIFCRIVRHEAPAEIVYEDKDSIAFLDINPLNPGHTLVVSKKHYATLDEMLPEEAGRLFMAAAKVMRGVKEVVKADGINIGQSNGRAASQDVLHVHVHIIPRFNHEGDVFPGRKKFGPEERRIGQKIKEAIVLLG